MLRSGKGKVTDQLPYSQKVSLWILPPREALREGLNNLYCVCQIFFRWLFPCCVPSGCLPSFLSSAVPYGLHPSQAYGPLKLQVLSSTGCNNSGNSDPLIFQANNFEKMFSSCFPLCALLSLAFLYKHSSLPSEAIMIWFSCWPNLCTSSLLWCSLFSLLRCGVSSVNLQTDFGGI